MNITAIYAICKKAKHAEIITNVDNGIQFLGDGTAYYPLINHPRITCEHMPALLDIPEDKQSSFYVTGKEYNCANMPLLEDFPEDGSGIYEEAVEPYVYELDGYIPFCTSMGFAMVSPEYIKPVKNIKDIAYYERTTDKGDIYIAVKAGMFLVALIVPEQRKITEKYVFALENLCRGAKAALCLKEVGESEDSEAD